MMCFFALRLFFLRSHHTWMKSTVFALYSSVNFAIFFIFLICARSLSLCMTTKCSVMSTFSSTIQHQHEKCFILTHPSLNCHRSIYATIILLAMEPCNILTFQFLHASYTFILAFCVLFFFFHHYHKVCVNYVRTKAYMAYESLCRNIIFRTNSAKRCANNRRKKRCMGMEAIDSEWEKKIQHRKN